MCKTTFFKCASTYSCAFLLNWVVFDRIPTVDKLAWLTSTSHSSTSTLGWRYLQSNCTEGASIIIVFIIKTSWFDLDIVLRYVSCFFLCTSSVQNGQMLRKIAQSGSTAATGDRSGPRVLLCTGSSPMRYKRPEMDVHHVQLTVGPTPPYPMKRRAFFTVFAQVEVTVPGTCDVIYLKLRVRVLDKLFQCRALVASNGQPRKNRASFSYRR